MKRPVLNLWYYDVLYDVCFDKEESVFRRILLSPYLRLVLRNLQETSGFTFIHRVRRRVFFS
jgi:hypothetical protein